MLPPNWINDLMRKQKNIPAKKQVGSPPETLPMQNIHESYIIYKFFVIM
jgi:hypothetical protein